MNRILGIGLTIFVLAGCETVQMARELQQQKPAEFQPGERTVTPAEVDIQPGQKLTLAELEKIAMFAHPSVLQAKKNVELAELDVKFVKADYQPTFAVNAGYQHGTYNRSVHDLSWRSKGSFQGALSFDLLLWDFGRTDAKINQAVQQLIAAEKNERGVENKVLLDVRLADSAVKRALALHRVAVQSVAQYKEHLDQMKERFTVGKGTEYDRMKAEVDWSQSELDATITSNNIETSKANLTRCLGFADEISIEVADGEVTHFTNTVVELRARARATAPTLAALRANVQAASQYIDQTVAELYPELRLSVGGNASGVGWPLLWNLAGVGLLTQNVYNGGRDMLAIQDAMARLQVARSKVAEYEQTLYYNLRKAQLDAQRAKDSLEVARRSEKLAEDNLRIVNERFNVGKASSIERTDAQVQHSNAQAAVVTAIYDDRDAQVQIAYLIGE